MKSLDIFLDDSVKKAIQSDLKTWIKSEKFKNNITKELGMDWDDIQAKLKEKIKKDPKAIEKAVSTAFDKILG